MPTIYGTPEMSNNSIDLVHASLEALGEWFELSFFLLFEFL